MGEIGPEKFNVWMELQTPYVVGLLLAEGAPFVTELRPNVRRGYNCTYQ